MNTHTPSHIIAVVVYTMAALSLIFFSTVSACAILKIEVEPMYYTVGGGIVTGMLAMLVNTRSGDKGDSTTSKTVIATEETTIPKTT